MSIIADGRRAGHAATAARSWAVAVALSRNARLRIARCAGRPLLRLGAGLETGWFGSDLGDLVRSDQIVVSVEHASARVPAGLHQLGLSDSWLQTHHGWDPGAAAVGRYLARRFAAPLHLGRWSRLVADLNRSASHPRVVPKSTGRRAILVNQDLSSEARRQRLNRYWSPYREAVEADLDRVVARYGRVLHISVHSFTPRLRGEVRSNHFGLLYGPSRRLERAMADRWDRWLSEAGFRVRRNYPYSGLEDGFCMRMRAVRPAQSYLGMEVEMNQRWVRSADGARRFAAGLGDVLARECGVRVGLPGDGTARRGPG